MISLLFHPWTKYVVLMMLAIGLTTYGIHSLKQEAVKEVEHKATVDALRRVENAVRSGDAVDVSPDGLRKSDGHRRD